MNNNSRRKAKQTRKEKRTGAAEVISTNPRRNMQQIVVKGTDEKGIGFSRTIHTKLVQSKPCNPKPRRDGAYQPIAMVKPTAPIPGEGEEAIPEVAEV